MKDCNCNSKNKPVTTEYVLDLDVDDLATPPDFFMATRVIKDPTTGATTATPELVPGEKVMPTGSNANIIALDTNNSALEVPEHQVMAGYLDAQPGGNIMKASDATHRAMFLMLGKHTEGKMLVQTTGFLRLPGHQYIPLNQYYADEQGMPTTDETVTGQKLFMPLDDLFILVNGEF